MESSHCLRGLSLPSIAKYTPPSRSTHPLFLDLRASPLPASLSCRSSYRCRPPLSPLFTALSCLSTGETGSPWIPLLVEVEATVVLARDRSTSLDGSHTLFPTFLWRRCSPLSILSPLPPPFRELRGHLSAVKSILRVSLVFLNCRQRYKVTRPRGTTSFFIRRRYWLDREMEGRGE